MKTRSKKVLTFTFIIAILIPLLTGIFSAFLTAGDMKLYETMTRPALSPPGFLFPIVWTVLYIVMGTASFFIYTSDAEKEQKRRALSLYVAQLLMNFFWSTLFFTYQLYFLSFLWLMGMWVLILLCGIRFYKIHRASGIMMGGLLLWTTFAAYLNFASFIINI